MCVDGILPRVMIYGFCLVSIASGASSVVAQNIKATLGGKVLDPHGMLIPGVVLRIRDLERGHIRQVTSNDKGMFLQPGLEPGAYKIEATQAGFARYESGVLPLKVGDFLNVEVHLSTAGVASTVEVIGQASTVSADHPNQFKSFNSDEMNDLPVFAGGQGRNFYAQALTTAGVALSTLAHRPFAVSGQRPRNNNYLIDSAEMNDANSGFIAGRAETEQLISQEAVQSFQIITHNFKAEYGRNSGSIVNLVSKSGSNQLWGSVYEYHNNSALSARNPFETPATKASQRSNLAGFTAGGPIRSNAIHVFGNYEFFRTRGDVLRNYQSLTEDERARAVPAVRPLVALYPISPSGSRIVTRGVPSTGDQNTYLIRGDIASTKRQTLMIRTNYTDSQRDIDGIGNTVSSHVNIHNQTRSAAVHHSFSAGPTGLNELRFNYTRQTEEDDFLDPVFLGDPRINGEVGFVIVPGLSLAGPLGFLGRANIQNTYRASDDLTLVRGRHVLKFGTSASRVQVNGGTVNNGFRGTLFFPNRRKRPEA
jgi:Carboxypeptidase regulatory-like domain